MTPSSLIHVATIGKPHGVRGLVHIQPKVEDPRSLALFPYLQDGTGKQWQLQWYKNSNDVVSLTSLDGEPIADRDEAARMTRKKLFVPRSFLPDPGEGEFYLTDLLMMDVYENGTLQSKVKDVCDYGAGVFLELADGRLIPFTKRCVPQINAGEGWLIIEEPEEIITEPTGPS